RVEPPAGSGEGSVTGPSGDATAESSRGGSVSGCAALCGTPAPGCSDFRGVIGWSPALVRNNCRERLQPTRRNEDQADTGVDGGRQEQGVVRCDAPIVTRRG